VKTKKVKYMTWAGNSLDLKSGSPQGSSSTFIGPSSTNPTRSTKDITAIAT